MLFHQCTNDMSVPSPIEHLTLEKTARPNKPANGNSNNKKGVLEGGQLLGRDNTPSDTSDTAQNDRHDTCCPHLKFLATRKVVAAENRIKNEKRLSALGQQRIKEHIGVAMGGNNRAENSNRRTSLNIISHTIDMRSVESDALCNDITIRGKHVGITLLPRHSMGPKKRSNIVNHTLHIGHWRGKQIDIAGPASMRNNIVITDCDTHPLIDSTSVQH